METPEQKTARITKEIEEDRKRRHEKMDQEFEVQRKIKKSEVKEHKKIKKEEKSERKKYYRWLIIIFIIILLLLFIKMLQDNWIDIFEMVMFWLLWFLKWIVLPIITIVFFVWGWNTEFWEDFPWRSRLLVFLWWLLCLWLVYLVWIFETIQENLEDNRKRIVPLCAIIITYKVIWYINHKKEQ